VRGDRQSIHSQHSEVNCEQCHLKKRTPQIVIYLDEQAHGHTASATNHYNGFDHLYYYLQMILVAVTGQLLTSAID